jgi:hypothetical protein
MLKKVGFVILAATVMVFSMVSSLSSVSAQSNVENCPACGDKDVAKTYGSEENQQKLKNFVFKTKEYKKLKRDIKSVDGKIDKKNAGVFASKDGKLGSYMLPIKDASNNLQMVTFYVNLKDEELLSTSNTYIEKIGKGLIQYKVTSKDETLLDLKINKDGEILTEDGTFVDAKTYYQENAPIKTLGFCESTAKGFYNAVNAFGCVYACVVVGAITSFFGGLACSGICYYVKDLSKDGFVDFVCN